MSATFLLLAATIVFMIFTLYQVVDRVLLSDEEPEFAGAEVSLREIDDLSQRRTLLLRELKDIEFDYETGKIDKDDRDQLNKRYRGEWLKIDKALDQVSGVNEDYLARVDQELERRLSSESFGDERTAREDRWICATCGGATPKKWDSSSDCGTMR